MMSVSKTNMWLLKSENLKLRPTYLNRLSGVGAGVVIASKKRTEYKKRKKCGCNDDDADVE